MSILSNNRFLQRVNPEIARARTDAGASLVSDHAVIQPLMRQMVDLGIADSLKLWVHSGLVDTVSSGGNLLIPKAYDISGEENDAVQATPENQPRLISDGMDFSGDFLVANNTAALGTVMTWINLGSVTSTEYFLGGDNQGVRYNGDNFLVFNGSTGFTTVNWTKVSAYVHFATTRVDTTVGYDIYINAEKIGTSNAGNANNDIIITDIGRRPGSTPFYFRGPLNDIRIFNSTLSTSQITSIYNSTKGYYGIT